MRTTLELDEKLVEATVKLTGEKNRGRAVSKALEEYIRKRKIEQLIELAGNIELDLDDWYEFRHMER
jgi:hypothetical protein